MINMIEAQKKVEIEIDGKRYEVSDPYHYKPNDAWSCKVILTVKWKFGNSSEISSSTLTIKGIEYQAISISNIKPVDILPVIWQVDEWDKECYNHIEHLRVAKLLELEIWCGNMELVNTLLKSTKNWWVDLTHEWDEKCHYDTIIMKY